MLVCPQRTSLNLSSPNFLIIVPVRITFFFLPKAEGKLMHPCGNIWRSGALLLGPFIFPASTVSVSLLLPSPLPLAFGFSLLISSQGSQPDMVKGEYFTAMLSTSPWHPYYHSKSKSPSVIPKVLLWLSHSWVTTLLWLHCPIYPVSSSPWIYFRHAHTSRTWSLLISLPIKRFL